VNGSGSMTGHAITTVTRKGAAIPLVVVALAALLPFINTLGNGFAYDDIQLLEMRPELGRSWGSVLAELGRDYWEPTFPSGLYRPLTKASFALERLVVSRKPAVHHATNSLLHAVAACLLLLLGRRVLGHRGALLGALLFALHPLHTEAVAGIAGRADLLALVFVLLALLAHLRLPDEPGARVLVPAALLLLGLLCKEIAVVFLPLVVLLDLATGRFRKVVRTLPGYLVALALLFLLRYLATDRLFPLPPYFENNPLLGATIPVRITTGMKLLAFGTFQWLFPLRLSADYSYRALLPSHHLLETGPLAGAAVLLVLAVLLLRARRTPQRLLPLLLVILPLSIVSNVPFLIGTIYGERLLYVPSAGVCLAMGGLVAGWLGARGSLRTGAVALVLLVGILYPYRTSLRNEEWRNEVTLFAAAARATPESVKVHLLLGQGRQRRGDLEGAEDAFRASAAIDPTYGHAFVALGRLFLQQERWSEARAPFLEAFERSRDPDMRAEGAWRLGAIASVEGDPREAELWFRRGIEIAPDRAVLHRDLGAVLAAQGRDAEALPHLEKALALDPGDQELQNMVERMRK